MTAPDWGLEEPVRTFGPDAWSWEPVHSDELEDLPEVIAAAADGWFAVTDAPLWCFVPAIWPTHARAWVRDTRVRTLKRGYPDGRWERQPWTAADHAEVEQDVDAHLARLGVAPRPAGRVWLLRPPPGIPTVQHVLDDVWAGSRRGSPREDSPAFAEYTAARVAELFG